MTQALSDLLDRIRSGLPHKTDRARTQLDAGHGKRPGLHGLVLAE